jgi:hypothetical protein
MTTIFGWRLKDFSAEESNYMLTLILKDSDPKLLNYTAIEKFIKAHSNKPDSLKRDVLIMRSVYKHLIETPEIAKLKSIWASRMYKCTDSRLKDWMSK